MIKQSASSVLLQAIEKKAQVWSNFAQKIGAIKTFPMEKTPRDMLLRVLSSDTTSQRLVKSNRAPQLGKKLSFEQEQVRCLAQPPDSCSQATPQVINTARVWASLWLRPGTIGKHIWQANCIAFPTLHGPGLERERRKERRWWLWEEFCGGRKLQDTLPAQTS